MVGSQCISTSYSCGAKEQGEMQKSFDVPHFMGNSSRTKSSFTYQRKGNDENHERNCSKSGSSRTSEQKNRGQNDLGLKRKLVIGKRNQHKGNECLFAFSQSSLSMAASSTTSKRLLLAFLFSSWVCASVCSASDPRHHSFSVENTIDPEIAAVLIDPALESNIFSPEPSQFHVIEDSENDCVKITLEEGIFHYKSRGGSRTCGLYVSSDPNKLIVLSIEYLDVRCDQGGLISVVDGWEMSGAVFPSYEDHEKSPSNRFHDLCVDGKHSLPVRRIFTSSQNAALIQYRIPVFGQGFSVRVEHVPNPRPCNILVQDIEGIFTLENHGRNVNCSLMTIFDSKIRIAYLSTGLHHRASVKPFSHSPRLQRGIYHKCAKLGLEDYVQIGGSSSLDTTKAETVDQICGYQPHPSSKSMTIFCGMTSVRLVSSGKYANKVVMEVLRATIDDLDSANYICDLGLDMDLGY